MTITHYVIICAVLSTIFGYMSASDSGDRFLIAAVTFVGTLSAVFFAEGLI